MSAEESRAYIEAQRARHGYEPADNDPETMESEIEYHIELKHRMNETRAYQLDRWGLDHDDEKEPGSLQRAAIVYLARSMGDTSVDHQWPWPDWPKPEFPQTTEEYQKLVIDAMTMIGAEYTKHRREIGDKATNMDDLLKKIHKSLND